MSKSKIEWTDQTWNPVTGCTKISSGCKNCYAERMVKRLKAIGQDNYRNGFEVTCHEHVLEKALHWKRSRKVFVNSMSDIFHKDVPIEFILKIFKMMNTAQRHTFQVLTKRSERLTELNSKLNWADNIWMGVTLENADYKNRIEDLSQCNAKLKFLSIEPLIAPIGEIDLTEIDWVIVGGESGPKSRPMEKDWVVEIRDQCIAAKVPFFFKQWGGTNKKKAGRMLDDRTWDESPST